MSMLTIIENISMTAWLLAVVGCYVEVGHKEFGYRRWVLAVFAVPATIALVARIWA